MGVPCTATVVKKLIFNGVLSTEAWKTFRGLEKVLGQSNKSFNLKIGGVDTGLEVVQRRLVLLYVHIYIFGMCTYLGLFSLFGTCTYLYSHRYFS